MYKILHKFLGWNYVLVRQVWVRRVEYTPNGRPYILDGINFVFLDYEWPDNVEKLTW